MKLQTQQTRPFTESSLNSRPPRWYEELLSETGNLKITRHQGSISEENIEYTNNDEQTKSPDLIMFLDQDEKTVDNLIPQPDESKTSRLSRRSSNFLSTPDFSLDNRFNLEPDLYKNTDDENTKSSVNKNDIDTYIFKRKLINQNVQYTNLPTITVESVADANLIESNLDERDNELIIYEEEHDFIIPELPTGSELCLHLETNWGDHEFIGLNGIEIFDVNGHLSTNFAVVCD